MKKLQFLFILFILLLPVTVMATEAKIIVIGREVPSSELYSENDEGETGDCVLIESQGEYLLVDTCLSKHYGTLDFLKEYLQNKEVKSISIMVSHYHNDHYNGLYLNSGGIFYNGTWNSYITNADGKYHFLDGKIKKIYLPDPSYLYNYYNTLPVDNNATCSSECGDATCQNSKCTTSGDIAAYNYMANSARNVLGDEGLVHLWPTEGGTYNDVNHFEFGDVKVDVIGPIGENCTSNCGHEYDNAYPYHGYKKGHYINDHSLVTMFTIGNVKYLSGGDIESSTEVSDGKGISASSLGSFQEERLVASKCSELKADILKLSHHGIGTSNSNAFLYCVKPQYAFYNRDNGKYAEDTKPEIDQILYTWRHKINMYSSLDAQYGGNRSFAFHIKDNQISVEKINFTGSDCDNGTVRCNLLNSTNFTDVTLNYVSVDENDNEYAIGGEVATFSNKESAYYYLTSYTPTYIEYNGNSYIYDFQRNSFATGGTSLPNSETVYYKKLNYTIDQENKIIKGIDFHQKGTTLYSNLGFAAANDAVYYRDNLVDNRSDILKTGDEIRFTMNNRENVYKIAVKGDIEGKGYLTSDGAKLVAEHILDGDVLADSALAAADYNSDSNVKMSDVMRMLNDMESKKATGFRTEGNSKYYYDAVSGEMHIGWLEYQNNDYYFNSDGKMLTSWNVIDGRAYYFDDDGVLLSALEGYEFNTNQGEKPYLLADTGWVELDDRKYYCTGDNTFAVGWLNLNDDYYYLDETGKMLSGNWYAVINKPRTNQYWYYFDQNGLMLKGWQKIGDYWYYMNADGRMLKGWQKLDYNNVESWFYFSPAGVMSNTGWKQIDYEWYYFNPGGTMATGWLQLGDYWYYLGTSGKMVIGWEKINGYWYYFHAGGTMATGWEKINNTWYYFNSSGRMLSDTCEVINSTNYCFSSSGACTNC